jgi:hypothetical protein
LSWTRHSVRLAACAALAAAGCARAALPDEIQVYTDDLEAPGARGVELHINTTPSGNTTPGYPGEVTTHHGLRITPEISWGLATNWDWGLYLPLVRNAEGTTYFAGPKFRLKWLPLRPTEGTGSFAGVNLEVAFVDQRFVEAQRTLEIRPIFGWRGAKWLLAFNPTMGADLAGEDRGVLVFHPAVKVARDVGERTALGIEYYADFGRLSDPLPRAEQSHTLFAVLDLEGKLGLNLGVGYGLTSVTDRWTIKAIVSF